MKIYIHEGKGSYLGSTVIVLAENIDDAIKLIRKELDNIGLGYDIPTVRCLGNHEDLSVIYSYNGDY